MDVCKKATQFGFVSLIYPFCGEEEQAYQSMMAILTLRAWSVMMAKRVISEAVPAVVLTATRGIIALGTLFTPS